MRRNPIFLRNCAHHSEIASALNVGAMLITFIALLALLNAMMAAFTGFHTWPGFPRVCKEIRLDLRAHACDRRALERCDEIADLLGTRMVLNNLCLWQTSYDEGGA